MIGGRPLLDYLVGHHATYESTRVHSSSLTPSSDDNITTDLSVSTKKKIPMLE